MMGELAVWIRLPQIVFLSCICDVFESPPLRVAPSESNRAQKTAAAATAVALSSLSRTVRRSDLRFAVFDEADALFESTSAGRGRSRGKPKQAARRGGQADSEGEEDHFVANEPTMSRDIMRQLVAIRKRRAAAGAVGGALQVPPALLPADPQICRSCHN